MKRIQKIAQREILSNKNLLYPDFKSKDKKIELKSIHNIKIVEEKNKKIKEEKPKIIKNDFYKNNTYTKISPLLKTINNKIKNKIQRLNNIPNTPINKDDNKGDPIKKPSTSNQRKKPNIITKINKEEENIYNLLKDKKESMFDKYYSKRIRAKTPSLLKHVKKTIEFNNKNNILNKNKQETPFNINSNERIYNIINNNNETNYNKNYNYDKELKNNIIEANKDLSYDKINILEEPKINDSSEIERLILEYKTKYGSDDASGNIIKNYSNNNQNIKNINNINDLNYINTINSINKINKINDLNSIPEVDEKLETTMRRQKIILPTIKKNHMRENGKLISENKIRFKNKNIEENINNVRHKNYGIVPSYIKRYQLGRELIKEVIKKKKETEAIPKRNKLLTDEE